MPEEMFDIIDENDAIVDRVPRSVAHARGLRHRAVHVLFITPAKDLILQRRSMTKDTYPCYLTVTVGGHVSAGSDYDRTVVTEITEETGLRLPLSALIPIGRISYDSHDPTTGAHDCESVMVYGHIYRGDIAGLRIEPGDGLGFEKYSLERLLALTPAEREREKIVPMLFRDDLYLPLYPKFMVLAES